MTTRTRGSQTPSRAEVVPKRETAGDADPEETDAELSPGDGTATEGAEMSLSESLEDSDESEEPIEPESRPLAPRTSTYTIDSGPSIPPALMANPMTRFIAESYLELRKVTWPTRPEAWNMTLVVIAMSAFVAVLLGAADLGLTHALSWIVALGH